MAMTMKKSDYEYILRRARNEYYELDAEIMRLTIRCQNLQSRGVGSHRLRDSIRTLKFQMKKAGERYEQIQSEGLETKWKLVDGAGLDQYWYYDGHKVCRYFR